LKKTRRTFILAALILCQSVLIQAFTAPAPAWSSSDQQPYTGGIVAPLKAKLETALSLFNQFLPSPAYAAESAWSDTREIRQGDETTGYLEASIQNGWLHARRLDAAHLPIWHVVLARAVASAPPTLKTGHLLEVRHADGRYFIRDLAGRVSAACEKPETDPMSGVDLTHLPNAITQSSGQAGGLKFTTSQEGNWIWMIVGHEERPWQIAVRMSPDILVPETGRVGGSGIGLVEFQRDDATLTYDGETLKRYGIEGIPQYILIGKNGRLVSSGLRTHLPSEEEIEKLLAASGS